MLLACLQGRCGAPLPGSSSISAGLTVGDFCFLAGRPSADLVRRAGAPILVPRTPDWDPLIRSIWGNWAAPALRYAIRRESGGFDRDRLKRLAADLPPGYRLRPMDLGLHTQAKSTLWSKDLVANFPAWPQFQRGGLGICALLGETLTAGASSYAVADDAIEIEIDTHPDHRRRGLASACGAALILTCLDLGLYPGWDAHDLRSVALAEKLGYHLDHPYPVWIKSDFQIP